jgi:hypothetical protein
MPFVLLALWLLQVISLPPGAHAQVAAGGVASAFSMGAAGGDMAAGEEAVFSEEEAGWLQRFGERPERLAATWPEGAGRDRCHQAPGRSCCDGRHEFSGHEFVLRTTPRLVPEGAKGRIMPASPSLPRAALAVFLPHAARERPRAMAEGRVILCLCCRFLL